jgi:hypothetical protein
MDVRISLLNTLKKQLNNRAINKNSGKNIKTTPGNQEYSRLRAILLDEYVQSGMAFDEFTFNKAEVYSEFSAQGQLNFHIYPVIYDAVKPGRRELNTQKEVKEPNPPIQARIKF